MLCVQLLKEKRVFQRTGNPSFLSENILDWYYCKRCHIFIPPNEIFYWPTDLLKRTRCPCCHHLAGKGVKSKTKRHEHTLKRID